MANVPAGITVNDDLYSSVSTERESRWNRGMFSPPGFKLK